ncbi:hypothetical protein APU06_00035 [Escherichia coli]|nr:hypothetical protein AVR72_16490 [Escherichia coli]AMM39536.1 hypothetical protein AVR76_16205 [Escherichia coli]KSY61232.1 hypothetical protein APU06_00035 [Escherichia coli]KUU62191.1 hypothetical protein AWF24_20475 [Escherichia coli]OLS80106.1 hypothetical protein BJD19_24600 [Escherichia coli]
MPDALRLSGLHTSCNMLNLQNLVGRIRRSRRIRHKQRALCQQSEGPHLRPFSQSILPITAALLLSQQRCQR